MINLLSDTVTKPTPEMLEFMMAAEVGDDVFGEDPSINELETRVALMFGKEAALFCPSGTMTNQIALKVHTQPLDEVICDHYSHIYQYETAGYAYNSGIGINLITGEHGKITADQVEASIKPDFDWLPKSKLVVLENSCNKGGGSYYTLEEIKPIFQLCRHYNLKLHLDGARLFNVLVETGEETAEIGKYFDTISICISKGLGAPVGSLLIGNKKDLKQGRRIRKVMGGGMRQAGYLAAACTYALDHHIPQLKIDNERAYNIGQLLEDQDYVESVRPVMTNIVIFSLPKHQSAAEFVNKLANLKIKASAFGPHEIRLVLHRDLSDSNIEYVMNTLSNLSI